MYTQAQIRTYVCTHIILLGIMLPALFHPLLIFQELLNEPHMKAKGLQVWKVHTRDPSSENQETRDSFIFCYMSNLKSDCAAQA